MDISQDHYVELTKIKAFQPDVVLAYIYGVGLHCFVAQGGETGVSSKAVTLDGAGPPSLRPDDWKNVGGDGDLECFVSSMHETVEQNVEQALNFFQRAFILKGGRSSDLLQDADIRRAYLAL